MSLEKFSLKSLSTIDGERIAIAFEQALRRVVQDCEDRPGDSTARTVTLTLAVKPRLDVEGICDDCNIQVAVTDSVPKRKSMGSMLEWCSVYDEQALYIKVQKDGVSVDANRSRAHLTQKLQFKLEFTRAFSDLSAWVERPRSQQQVVAALRTALSGTFDDPMLPIFRRLDFQRKNDGSRSVNHTGESLGKSVEARAQTASGEIPEILVFSTPVYSNVASAPCVLRFALDVDANQELIKIAPVGDCIPSAFAEAQGELAADIKQKMPNALVVCCN